MLVSKERRFVFIHVPKTGGLAVRRALHAACDVQEIFSWHCLARDASKVLHDFGSYYSFGFVRNPWEAQVSMYHYVLAMGPPHPEWTTIFGYGSFEKYLERHVRPGWERGEVLDQSEYFVGPGNERLLSFVGRFETINRDFSGICRRLALPDVKLEIMNASVHGHYRDHYTAASQLLIRQIYRRDIDVFQYCF